jgi:glyoxylate carboligase
MILFIGQVGTDCLDREAFQEIDYRRMFGQMAKWVASIDRADRIPEYVQHAFHVATSGRPGPVVLALPEDMLTTLATVADAKPYIPVQAAPASAQMEQLAAQLDSARQPLLLARLLDAAWQLRVSGVLINASPVPRIGRVLLHVAASLCNANKARPWPAAASYAVPPSS